ncbi:uncharacterized protein [Nicotiana sylvestris]|uniref:Uncharacterized protein LOC104217096 n=1 Tax=Nicotiana sylvestris TaxID=4096 RepID=A0A1U7VVA7_NICSY|nr:PREDICTED: uncharacterized protein LOC104217096 [Nicotiana sylvestris]
MLLAVVPNEWLAEAFTKGLNSRSSDASRKLKESLLEFQATTWADVHNRYESKIRIEEDQFGFPASTKGRDREKNKEKLKDDLDIDQRPSRGQFCFMSGPKDTTEVSVQRIDSLPTGELIMARIIGDSQHLREEVETLLKNGHLREFLRDQAKNNYGRNHDNAESSKAGDDPSRLTINMISIGNKINGITFSAAKKTKVSVTHSKRLQEVTEDDITFMEEDTDRLLLSHNDALVISLNVLDFKIKRVLVDPGSSANIIQWRVFEQAKLTGSIIPAIKLLVGFNLASVTTQ